MALAILRRTNYNLTTIGLETLMIARPRRSVLYMPGSNTRAIALYTALGFKRVRSVMFHRVERTD